MGGMGMINHFFENFDAITDYYNFLIAKTKNLEYVGITNEWLIDNYYLLVEHKNNIVREKKQLAKQVKHSLYMNNAIKKIISKNNYNIDFHKLVKELNSYQHENHYFFSYKEITFIPILLLFNYVERLRELCEDEKSKLVTKDFISEAVEKVDNKEIAIEDFITTDFDFSENFDYIYELNNQLKELGTRSNKAFKELNKILEAHQISLKEVLNEAYQSRIDNNILISNLFNDLKEFFELTSEELFENISLAEKRLMRDEIYDHMTVETKNMYRNRIVKLAKKAKLSEYEYISGLIKEGERNEKHIGFYLFEQKNYMGRVWLYILFVVIVSVIITYFLAPHFLSNWILSFVILIIPVMQLVIQIVNHLMTRFVRPKPIPKMDYSKGIPEKDATMVVIPTIISNTKKIKEMFDTLETYYLVNRTNNLYFTLLGDVKAEQKAVMPYDKEVSEYGVMYAKKLNEKYKKEIFHFVYRKRFYNPKESCYLGYERKRGALLQFNRLLLRTMSKEDQQKYYVVHTLKDFHVSIKYVITLDTDTRLVLNTALNLVGAMAHPLNHPVLNKKESKVIRGYALMQPRVSVDIESTNKSLYSQIFASIGGFDSYTAIVPKAYQDSFNEGSFIGKGIYDLKVFDEIMNHRFPDNLILSHDLLEGNYLRCGYVGDIELIDDFPAKFLTDSTRQHRWARGDVQIIGWLFPRVKNQDGKRVQNPVNTLGKWKIFDNIARMFLQPAMLLVLILAIFFGKTSPIWWILFILLEIFLPIIFYLQSKIYDRHDDLLTVYYKNLMNGSKSILLRSYIVLATIPFYSKLYMDAFFRTMYRLLISHKNLLNWITAEEAEKTMKSDLPTYIRNFLFNLILGIVLVVVGLFTVNLYAIIFGLIFISAPFVLYKVSQPIPSNLQDLTDDEKDKLLGVARRTWHYFEENLTPEYHYLIPDNYQENREDKLDLRTSPTDIAFSLLAVVSADELGFIKTNEAIRLISNIIDTVEDLEKWNGHLYNWYSIKTMSAMQPQFVSTIDSGNFVASLMVVQQFLLAKNDEKLAKKVERLVRNTNFKKLYNKKDVFSIGYDVNEAALSIYNYNKFASESRLTSFIAIAKGDVPSKHWFCLDKSLTSFNHAKGLISWSGTSFEYYMPYLFMKNYPNTLLDETYHFAHMCQKEYMASIDKVLPWGISECAYDELDNAQNYKYRAFSTPYLKAKEEKDSRIVLSPYSSFMATRLFPEDVYRNMLKFRDLDMYGIYGFYESYDVETGNPVKAFFAHHQGMSLIGIANYLKDGLVQNYFHDNVSVQTFDILLKEKVQLKANIDMKIAKYKKYDYAKEKIENDIRAFNYVSDMPEVSVLSNKKYCLLMNDRGDSFSRYRTIQLNRYRKITEQDYGYFLYIKDLDTSKVWSNTYAPINIAPDKYEVIFASDKIKYIRTDGDITTTTEIAVTKEHHAEIRKITFTNSGDEVKRLELTSYMEPIICENMADVSHRVFNSMFLESTYDEDTHSLITMRKARNDNETNVYVVNRMVIEDPLEEYQYETDRFYFLGRNHNASNPEALVKPLTNTAGTNVEPIMSLRNQIEVLPNDSTTVCLINGFGRSKEQIMDIVRSYDDNLSVKKAFEVANLMNIVNTKTMNLTGSEMRVYNIMLNYLYQTTKIAVNEERKEFLKKNALAQNGLWKFGVSGDYPIILVEINDIGDISFVMDILKCFEYYKNNSIFVDIIIINSENSQYAKLIQKAIDEEKYRMYTVNNFYHTPGTITVINNEDITKEDRSVLNVVPRLRFILDDHKSLKEKMDELQKENKISHYSGVLLQHNVPVSTDDYSLDYKTDFGGFTRNGNEYVIYNRNTPTPWSNVIANSTMGTIITNNGCGYTFAYNSGEFKITSWTNDMVTNDKSEGIKVNGEIFDPTVCRHGFGYSVLESETSKLKQELTEFVATEDNVKFFLFKMTNKDKKKQKLRVSFWLNPTFGNFEEKTSRHILTEFMGADNYMKMRNVYSINYSNVSVFMSSSLPIIHAVDNKVLLKQIDVSVELDAQEDKTVVFTLGCAKSDAENLKLIHKYNNLTAARNELKAVKDLWKDRLSVLQVKTPDKSTDFMLNGWYLYQTISSRLLARAGFYQVSGAFGYRDQLQDAMNIVYALPELTRRQILTNAAHQFEQGDVLHWWHESNHFGLRSLYKDDYLWLVYATIEYLTVTEDYDILKEKVPFATGEELKPGEHEKGITFGYTKEKVSLLEHMELSLHLTMNSLGVHGLPLMGGGDWNDGMNRVGVKGKGESVWLGLFFCDILSRYIPLMQKINPKYNVKPYQDAMDQMAKSLNEHAWDGTYYLRAYFDNGAKLGSHENTECKIDLISQSFAVLSGVAPKDRETQALNSVHDLLVDKENGLVKLLTPAFSKSVNNPGYIMSYPEGLRENGGQYTHSVAWYLMALIKAHKYDEAYEYFHMINPVNKTATNEAVYRYKVEPYVIAADIYSSPRYPGRGGWTWYTGSAGWFYKVGMRDILGFYKEGDIVRIAPHVPAGWKEYKIQYRYLDTTYQIIIKLGKENKVTIDGKKNTKMEFKLTNDKKTHEIEIQTKDA